jgi:hypothetical protein
MTAHASRTIAVLGCAAFVLTVVQACSGEPRKAIAPPAKIDAGAPPGEQGCICPPQAPCPFCPAPSSLCPPAASANRTPEPCKTDIDCSSGFCDKGFCGPLRTGNLPNGGACNADAQCQSGLCDRDVCTDIGGLRNGNFGATCEHVPPFEQRKPKYDRRRDQQCVGYLCLDGRCRSCVSDADCMYWNGGGTCEHTIGLPGKSCWGRRPLSPDSPYRRPPPLPPDPPLEKVCVCPPEPSCPPCPPPPSTCPHPSPSGERYCDTDKDCSPEFCVRGYCMPVNTGYLFNGYECKADKDCESGMCDRGVCTDIGGPRNGHHGEPCQPSPPFARRAGRSEDPCGGYICLDGSCRSCVSDAECTYWKGGGTCDYHPGLPGQRCSGYPPRDPASPPKPPAAVPP